MQIEQPFLVPQGRQRGLTEGELRSSRWNRSVYGVRAREKDPALAARCRMFAARLPGDAFFSHSTAALLLGMPLPWRLQNQPSLHVALPAPARAPHARGLVGHELDIRREDVISLHGVRMTAPARTWCDLGRLLRLHDLVAAGDFVIHWRTPLASLDELAAAAGSFAGKRGMRVIREALPYLSDRAESPPESFFRVIAQQGGLPTPTINHTIVDTETGRDVRPDFMFKEQRVLVEYQGDYHRTKKQWRKDLTRRSRLESLGWTVIEIGWDDLLDPVELVARIRRVLNR